MIDSFPSKNGLTKTIGVSILSAGLALLAFDAPALADDYATAAELGLMEGFPPPPDKQVDSSNALMTPPFNRWAYQNMRTIYPSAGIPSAEVPSSLRLKVDAGIERLTVKREDGSEAGFDTYLQETFTDALVVIHGDAIVFERYLNGMHANQPHQMMSVTKSFAGLFGLLAVADGKLGEDDLLVTYVPELEASGSFGDATFGHVLNMVNSMDLSEDYADPTSGIVQYGKVLGWIEASKEDIVADNMHDFLVTLEKDPEHPEHGEMFHYQTPKTDVVNWVTNRVTGKSFQDNMYDVLWSKIGTEGETYVLLDRNGTLVAGGGLNATPHNLTRFAMMMLNDGMAGGEQVVPSSVIDTLAAGASREAFSAGPDAKGIMGGGDWSYRAQWWVRHTPGREAFSAIGIHGQWIYIDVERDVAIVKQSSQPESATNYFDEHNINAFDAIIAHLTK